MRKLSDEKTLAILIVTGFCLFLGFWFYPRTSAEQAFTDFQTKQTKESYIVVPLCNAGENVVPLVIEKIKNKELERRRYAISFLGTGEYPEAIPVLEKIAGDETETIYFRADALESLYLIDETKGKSIAQEYRNRDGLLGEVSREVLDKKDYADYSKKTRDEICHPTD